MHDNDYQCDMVRPSELLDYIPFRRPFCWCVHALPEPFNDVSKFNGKFPRVSEQLGQLKSGTVKIFVNFINYSHLKYNNEYFVIHYHLSVFLVMESRCSLIFFNLITSVHLLYSATTIIEPHLSRATPTLT